MSTLIWGSPNFPATADDIAAADAAGCTQIIQIPNGGLVPGLNVVEDDAQSISQQVTAAQIAQILTLQSSYQSAISAQVAYTSTAGVSKTYQADQSSVNNLQNSFLGCFSAQATPPGFYWVSVDNTQVPFTYSDLQGLATAMFTQGLVAFNKLQTLKTQVNSATTLAAVQAITW